MMKRLLILLCAALISATAFSQSGQGTTNHPETFVTAEEDNSPTWYAAAGLSVAGFQDDGNQTFANTSFASAEIGTYWENIAVAGVFGISTLDATDSFWYEGKVMYTQPWETVSVFALLGVGTYTDNSNVFLEYGGGFSVPFESFALFTQLSNWDRVNYISVGASIDLN